ncbi:MAG: hypothetical protein C5B55_09605 [Blastocatellia bacterium]|nr:MAG: hypothetical protein C5B55_09605 [Blastocatellia bacterium]
MTVHSGTSDALFESDPFPHFQRSLGLFRPVGRAVGARAVVVVLVGWFPLLVLILADALNSSSALIPFLKDFGVHARSLIAAPLFVICEAVVLQRLDAITYHFINAGLIASEDRQHFHRLIERCKGLMRSTLIEVLAFAASYLLAIIALRYIPPSIMPAWYSVPGSSHQMSWAGWWYTIVSVPLLSILIFSWLLRVMLWGRFLFSVSRMKLRLISAHPDHAAGLRFLNAELFAFMPLAFTFGVIAAGTVANNVTYHGASLDQLRNTVIGLLIFVLVIFVGPLMVFVYNLHRQKVAGIYSYGKLADSVGRQFERKWLTNYDKVGAGALEAPDFSATTDLYQIAENVYQVSIVPFEVRTTLILCITTLLPFVPVLLMLVPLKVILKDAASVLFGISPT